MIGQGDKNSVPAPPCRQCGHSAAEHGASWGRCGTCEWCWLYDPGKVEETELAPADSQVVGHYDSIAHPPKGGG